MSDVQCPARIVMLSTDEPFTAELVEAVRAQRPIIVRAAEGEHASTQAAALGEALGVDVVSDARLDIDPTSDASIDVERRWQDVLEEMADLYRGETAVAVTNRRAAPSEAGPDGALHLVEIDADGWRWRSA